jgi:methylmalonyl-CoA/ethylmalonyl-CoA epimerase
MIEKPAAVSGAPSRTQPGAKAAAEPDALPIPGTAVAVNGGLSELVIAVDHVGIAVPDLDDAVAYYTGTLGLVEQHREINIEQGVHESMLAARHAGQDATQIQLLAPLSPDSAIARFIGRAGPGLQQLAVRVADIEKATDVLRHRGQRLLYETARRGTAGSKINFIHPKDAGGVLIELVQTAPGA